MLFAGLMAVIKSIELKHIATTGCEASKLWPTCYNWSYYCTWASADDLDYGGGEVANSVCSPLGVMNVALPASVHVLLYHLPITTAEHTDVTRDLTRTDANATHSVFNPAVFHAWQPVKTEEEVGSSETMHDLKAFES